MLELFGRWLFFLRPRGSFFGLMDVHLLTRADVMLYFRQLLHADVTSSKCCAQRDGMSTCEPGQVPCCTSTTSAHRCVLIKIAARDATSSAATSCNSLLRQCCTYRVLASITHSADNLTNSLGLFGKMQISQPRR